ncbi:amidohydrolase [Nonomuraea sp. NBC_00507]|uniref:amidohydrolase n=1 Tax=Nonomuraea sp. NBC_00507 TaxID=2976002 RepID=UPI002E174C3D
MTHPSLVIRGAEVRTLNAGVPRAQAVAIRGDRIVAIGDDHEAKDWIGKGTSVIDAERATVLPGFHDAHIHPVIGALNAMRCDLTHGESVEDYQRLVADYVERIPQGWILGGGWALDRFPDATGLCGLLDKVTGDRPAFLVEYSQHFAWVNSAALARAGITRSTPDPPRGRIVRDADGEPTGRLDETAMELVRSLVPPPTKNELKNALLVVQPQLFAAGITRWHDAVVGYDPHDLPMLDAYLDAAFEGTLRATVSLALRWDRNRGLEQIDDLVKARDTARVHPLIRVGTVKIFQDGVCESRTAALSDPYLAHHPGAEPDHGISMLVPDALAEAVTRLDANGFQVHVHAIGDRAITEALDAIEAAREVNGPRDARHQIAHVTLLRSADIARFGRLGAIVNAQPRWAHRAPTGEDPLVVLVGEERARWQYLFRSLREAGAPMAVGSDWPVTTFDPFEIVHVGVNRAEPGEMAPPLDQAQRLGLDEMLWDYCYGSAFANFAENDVGTIEVGKVADLVVLDRDLHAVPASDIAEVSVRATVVRGEVVHRAGC